MVAPQLAVSPSAAKRVQHYDGWVFRDELLPSGHSLTHGTVVELIDRHGTFLAYAFYSAHSHIAARVVSVSKDQPVDRALLAERLTTALAKREAVSGTNAKRLVFSEADGIPGLIVDQYATSLVLQIRAAGLEPWKPTIIELLHDLVHPDGILERSDKEFREEERLPPVTQLLAGTVPDKILIEEDGLQFLVDPYRGHKTGFYMDQRETRRYVRRVIAPGQRVVDVCAYTGAFGIGAAAQGARVICVEQHEPTLELAKANAALNHVERRIEFVAGDAFYWLEAKGAGRERFDWVLLDPPALAKSKAETLKGRQALHRLLVHALGLLAPSGTLVLSICTYHLLGVAEEILRIAAAERGMRLRIVATTMQAPDHPWILQMPITRYLMSWVAQRDESPAA